MNEERSVRWMVWLIGAIMFVDTMFYAVVSPMLPSLSHEMGLTKAASGLLTASYSIGMLVASLPGGLLAVRIGPRLTVCLGLGLLMISTIGFAFAGDAGLLDASRLIEGVGGACTWAGGLAWLSAATPIASRGEVVGKALAAGIAGSLLGPAIGALATTVGRASLFSGLVIFVAVLLVATIRTPDIAEPSDQGIVHVLRALRLPAVLMACWLAALPGLGSGIMSVLAPLRLHALGASALGIGAVFLGGSLIETLLSPPVGRFSDRRGRIAPLRFGIVVMAAGLVGFMLADSLALAILIMLIYYVGNGSSWSPSMAMLADEADKIGLDQGYAAALMNLTWAGGQILGSAGGGAGGQAFGDLAVALAAAVLVLITSAVLFVRSRRFAHPRPPVEPG